MAIVFKKPNALTDKPFHYCPGCTHGIIHRLVAEVIDELDIEGETVGVSPVGCTYNNYEYFSCDMVQAAHGRAPAVATGLKRALPDKVVFTYQGDGDLAAIGTAEIVHAATREEDNNHICKQCNIWNDIGTDETNISDWTLQPHLLLAENHNFTVIL